MEHPPLDSDLLKTPVLELGHLAPVNWCWCPDVALVPVLVMALVPVPPHLVDLVHRRLLVRWSDGGGVA